MCHPTIHVAGCRHLKRIRRRGDYEAEYTIDVETLTDASLDFWSDIITSDLGLSGQEAREEAEKYLSEFEIGPCVTIPV
jgi:hypothetical protein